jgi:hypothetical protein
MRCAALPHGSASVQEAAREKAFLFPQGPLASLIPKEYLLETLVMPGLVEALGGERDGDGGVGMWMWGCGDVGTGRGHEFLVPEIGTGDRNRD